MTLISDGEGTDERTPQLTSHLVAHNDVLDFLIHDPMRLAPGKSRLTISDGTLQVDFDLADRALKDKVTADFRNEQEEMTRLLRRLSAPLLMISNEGDVVDQVRRLLGLPGRM